MIVTLFKTGKDGKLLYYTVHDRQASLISPYALTLSWRVGNGRERSRFYPFDSLAEMDKMIRAVLQKRFKDGYRLLYSFSRDARWSERLDPTEVRPASEQAQEQGGRGGGLLARAAEAHKRLATG